ncbi:MAG: N-6 DNA methylase [Lewinellaceae bacterium]|nr:N-6 DNA methylase [Lewinellaceae bacterium]
MVTLGAGFRYIENESFDNSFQGLFSEINLNSEKLGKTPAERNKKLCPIIQKIAEGIADFSTDTDTFGDAYEYLIGQFAAGSGKKAGEFYTPQQISTILSRIVILDCQDPTSGPKPKLNKVLDFACGSGSLLLNVRKRIKESGGSIGKIYGQENNITTYNLARIENFKKGKRQNHLRDKDIERIVKTYRNRPKEPIERYAHSVSMEEIKDNGYNFRLLILPGRDEGLQIAGAAIRAGDFHERIGGGLPGNLNPIGGSAVYWRINLKVLPRRGQSFRRNTL